MGEETVPSTGPGAGREVRPEARPEAGLGLRERKKRETRRRIADIATGLFLMRGFDNVTIADVARTADVSVNTVFNYFKTKEDLFFDREDEMVEAAARDVRDRRPGEGVVALFRRRFFEGLDAGEYRTAFHEGADAWLQAVHDSPALTARMRELGQRIQDELAALLAEETGAGPDDFTPRAAAAMIHAAQGALVAEIAARKRAGETLEEMRDDVYAAAARTFDLLEHGLGGYAAAPPAPPGTGN
ncbi:TetR/AcrR family transcriptional regulator [Actinomadura bangladeshensis]|uniref:TetR/AcrR family transcriptional regulator n=1 Tax=Actinomadura bangladeshensis TaxID=453573 RepID=A0A6L9QJ65_9ACTN|nr:TetR/AcrR family transcriptional regulator [Actinomadura bangladeshensis]NEA24124.1 TetR/AcrR family transcriptional regulator [Actinomadura bangladeshensis]